MNWYLKVLYILSWIPISLIKISLAVLGLLAVPLALHACAYKHNMPHRDVWPDILWIWGNQEEGPPRWWQIDASGSKNPLVRWFPNFWWYAIRNPVNNMRYIFDDREGNLKTNWYEDIPMEAHQMLAVGQQMAFQWVWNGPFAGYRRVWLNGQDRYSEIWFGWKVGSGVPGLGFTTQVRLKRKIGT